MTQGERVKTLRKALNLTLEKFGDPLGVGKTAISKIENNERGLTDQMIKAICREFGVNELWLRTGEGEMKKTLQGEDRFSLNIGKLQNTDNETLIRWVNAIAETNPELLKDIEDFFKRLLNIEKEPD